MSQGTCLGTPISDRLLVVLDEEEETPIGRSAFPGLDLARPFALKGSFSVNQRFP